MLFELYVAAAGKQLLAFRTKELNFILDRELKRLLLDLFDQFEEEAERLTNPDDERVAVSVLNNFLCDELKKIANKKDFKIVRKGKAKQAEHQLTSVNTTINGLNYNNEKNTYECDATTRETLGNLVNKINDAFKSISDLEEKLRALESEKATLESEKKTLESEKETLKSEKETLESEKETLESEKETLESEKETLESEKATLESEKATLESEKATLESEKKTLESEKKTLEEKVDQLEKSNKDLKDSIEISQQQQNDLLRQNQAFAKACNKNEQFHQQIAALKRKNAGLSMSTTQSLLRESRRQTSQRKKRSKEKQVKATSSTTTTTQQREQTSVENSANTNTTSPSKLKKFKKKFTAKPNFWRRGNNENEQAKINTDNGKQVATVAG